ncbi:uncharacterized protein LOC129747364 [Uranotaenia lowii]|uniref:uncharacterized protein LOC129747364 n=1 Tax=Uranotaenia lowii TaxID=190385 RepID=UPI0024795B32|nr:uncharacterized protein LOC129747364 [Uranotaenia lowii]
MSAKLEKTGKRISTNADLRRVAKQATNHDNGADGSSSGKVKPQEKTKTSLKSLFGDSPKKRKSNINPLEEIIETRRNKKNPPTLDRPEILLGMKSPCTPHI